MRVAYLITAYREPRHLQRLCRALEREDPAGVVMVQLDVGSPLAAQARDLGVAVELTRRPIRWGDGTYARALVDSLTTITAHEWDWVVLLSGQDYLLQPIDVLHRALREGRWSAYSPITGRLPSESPPEAIVERYGYRYWWGRGRWPRVLRGAARRSDAVLGAVTGGRVRVQPRPRGDAPGLGLRRRRTIFSEARPCYMGSDYVVMRRDACSSVLDLLEREPAVLDYFDRTFVPSEALFASVLRWVDPDAVENRNFHFMRFSGRANPRLLTPDDLPELWDLGAVFGRKFDDSSAWVEERLPMRSRPA